MQTVVYRGNNNGITAIPCEPLRLYKLSNKDMFSLYVESAIGAQDVRDLAAEAIKAYSDMAKALAQLSEDKTRIEKNLTDTKNELESTKEKLTAFEKTYNANIDKINDIIRRVETMEADYDVLIK